MDPNSEISGVLAIHHFGHQSCCGERSGRLTTAQFHVFPVRVFLDMSQEALIQNNTRFPGQNREMVRHGGA